MKRRLYFLIPKLEEAKKIFDALLVKRVPINNIKVIAKEGIDIGDLPEASIFLKYDIVYSMLIGIGLGAIVGIIGGIIAHYALDLPIGGGMVAAAFIGAFLGAWSATMIGLMVPNREHKEFHDAIWRGEILMIVDIPKERVEEIKQFVHHLTPQAHYQGIDPTIPRFP